MEFCMHYRDFKIKDRGDGATLFEDRFDRIKKKHLPSILLFGTHDSCSSKVSFNECVTDDALGRNVPTCQCCCGLHKFISHFSLTHNSDVAEQLREGIRIFDVRLCYSAHAQTVFTKHTFKNVAFGQVMSQIGAFLRDNGSEIVQLQLCSMPHPDLIALAPFARRVLTIIEQEVGEFILRRRQGVIDDLGHVLSSQTIEQLVSQNTRLILYTEEEYLLEGARDYAATHDGQSFIHPPGVMVWRDSVQGEYADTTSTTRMTEHARAQLNVPLFPSKAHRRVVWTLTPQTATIIWSALKYSCGGFLCDCCYDATAPQRSGACCCCVLCCGEPPMSMARTALHVNRRLSEFITETPISMLRTVSSINIDYSSNIPVVQLFDLAFERMHSAAAVAAAPVQLTGSGGVVVVGQPTPVPALGKAYTALAVEDQASAAVDGGSRR